MKPYPFPQDEWEHEQNQMAWLDSRPVCDVCGDPIQEDYYYEIGDMMLCERCIQECKTFVQD